MAGFIRRYGVSVGVETITLIEGVIILDLPPPGAINGVSSGTVAMIGEFSDMTNAVAVDSSGVVTTKAQPVEVRSGQDLIDKVGGFDSTIGQHGNAGGNGFISLRNKKFSRLILVPVNLASGGGGRAWRDLPTNRSATVAQPVVPMQGGVVSAGREFKTGASRVHIGKRIGFTAFGHYRSEIDGAVTSVPAVVAGIGSAVRVASTVTVTVANSFFVGQTVNLTPGEANFPAGLKVIATASGADFTYTEAGAAVASTVALTYSPVTQAFNVAIGNFLTARDGQPVRKGDLLVLGVISGAGALGANAFTYRVTADAVLDVALVVEKLDGAAFNWTTGVALPYRIHPGSDGDSAGVLGNSARLSDAIGYRVPCRPLDVTITQAVSLAPSLVPPAGSATSWDPLSGLTLRSHVSAGFIYNADVQGPNAANHASINALYATAIDSLLGDAAPARDANIVFSSRTDSAAATPAIRSALKSHVLLASENGVGREAVISPNLQTVSVTSATADADPGVGANRSERVVYAWPGARTFVPEAVNLALGTADGLTTTDGVLDVQGDGWMAAVLSNLAPERNPGQAGPPVDTVLAPIIGLQRGLSTFGVGEYIAFRAAGIAALRMDRTAGPIFQSGITTSLTSGQKNINRRRMADFIQDSISQRLVQFTKQPLTQALKDTITGEIDAFLNILLSPSNPAAQRITAYSIDDKSGNTPDLEAKGIYVVIGRVRTLATADFIVLQTEVGEGVNITTAT